MLVGFANRLPILAWPPHLRVVSSGQLTSWHFERHCFPGDVCLAGPTHVAPSSPSPHAKLCTYFRWFARPDRVLVQPCYELPMPITNRRLLFHFRIGAGSSLRPYSQQRPMRTNLSCCLGLIDNGQHKSTNRWAHIRCRLSKAGLQGQVRQDIYVAAHFASLVP